MKLGMLGMWHTHADGIVRRVAEHPDEFTLVGFYDRGPGGRAKPAQAMGAADRTASACSTSRSNFWPNRSTASSSKAACTRTCALARLALESGRPVMLEKPAGDRLDEYRRLVDLAQRKHLHVQMIYLFRYMSAVQEMLRRTRAGRIRADLRVPRAAAERPAVVRPVRRRIEALQGWHFLRDGRPRDRHDGRDSR